MDLHIFPHHKIHTTPIRVHLNIPVISTDIGSNTFKNKTICLGLTYIADKTKIYTQH